MDPSKLKVRFNFERLELRDTPAQLGVTVTLPQLPAEEQASDAAVTVAADLGHDGSASIKLDPVSHVRVKLDPTSLVNKKL
jgi:hypothetical protein